MTRAIRVLGYGTILSVFLGAAGGCIFVKSEKKQVENAIRDGIKEQLGKTVDSLDIRSEAGGKYVGTAQVEGETWDVTATVDNGMIRWETREQLNPSKIEKKTREVVQQKTGFAPENITVTPQGNDKFTGTFTLQNQKCNFTFTAKGRTFECLWEPAK
jgi:hypothetical protein